MARNWRLQKTGGTYDQSCMYSTDSAWPAFLMPFLLLLPVSGHLSRGCTVPPTKRAYSALHHQALTECSPLNFRRSSYEQESFKSNQVLKKKTIPFKGKRGRHITWITNKTIKIHTKYRFLANSAWASPFNNYIIIIHYRAGLSPSKNIE